MYQQLQDVYQAGIQHFTEILVMLTSYVVV